MPGRKLKPSPMLLMRDALTACPLVRLVGRTSVDRRADCASSQHQRQFLRAWAAEHDKTILGEYFDNDTSGAVPFAERPEGRRLLHDSYTSGNSNEQIIVYRADRFGRDQADTALVAKDLLQHGRLLVSAMEPFDLTTSEGWMFFGNLSVMAQFLRDLIKANANDGRKRAAKQNKWLGGLLPWGMMSKEKYVLMPSDRLLSVLGITEAVLVRQAVHEVIGGRSATAIVADLNRQGVPFITYTTLNNPVRQHTTACREQRQLGLLDGPCACPVRIGIWYPRQIAAFCHNPVYSGDASLNSAYWGPLPRTCDPIVTKAEQEQAEARLAEYKSYRKNMARARNYLLRGLVVCTATRSDGTPCGRRLTGAGGNASGHKHYYVCPRADGKHRFDPYAARCPGTKVTAVWLEDRVWEAALQVLARKDQVMQLVWAQLTAPTVDETPARLAAMAKRLQTIDAMVARAKLLVLDTDSGLTLDDFKEQISQLEAERTVLLADQQALTEAQQQASTQAARLTAADALATLLAQAQTTLDHLIDYRATDKRREVLDTLQTQVNVAPVEPLERRTRAAITIRFFTNNAYEAVFGFANRAENSRWGPDEEAGMQTVYEYLYESEELRRPPHRPVGERSRVMVQWWVDFYRKYPNGKGAPGNKPIFDEAQSLALLYEYEAGASLPALARKYSVHRKQIWKAVHRGLYLRDRAEEDV